MATISPEEFRKMFPNASKDAIAANIGGNGLINLQPTPSMTPTAAKRVRQSMKGLLNKLETDWLAYLRFRTLEGQPYYTNIRGQAMRFRLANGAWYKPDLTATHEGQLHCFECKGPKVMKNMARGMLTIKFAASAWPEYKWHLVWREGGLWKTQEILP